MRVRVNGDVICNSICSSLCELGLVMLLLLCCKKVALFLSSAQFILMVVVIFCDGAFSNIHEARIEALTLRIQEETIILSVFIVAGFSRKERIGKETTTIRIFTTTNQSWEF